MKIFLSSFVRTSRLRLVTAGALCLLAASCGVAVFALPSTSSPSGVIVDWQAKVDARVLTAATSGPTDFLIYMAQQADTSGAGALQTKAEKGAHVYQQLTAVAEATQPPVRALLDSLGATYRSFWISNTISTKGDLTLIQAVASLPEVAAIYPIGRGALSPPEEAASTKSVDGGESTNSANLILAAEPGLALVNADDVWALGYRGGGVTVAGADTGVRFTHNALRNQYRGWGGSVASSVHDYNWWDGIKTETGVVDPTNPCNGGGVPGEPSPFPCDDDEVLGGGHGTHTAGTMVGYDGGANQIGMAPQAEWVACRNLVKGVGTIPTYLDCMEWIIAPTKIDGTMPDPSKAADVVNNSWGCVEGCPPEPMNPLRDALQRSRDAGIVYVASAGNDGPGCGTIQNPLARYPEAFTVGNTTHTTDSISTSSSRGPSAVDPADPTSPIYLKPNITAPGSTIRSAVAYVGSNPNKVPSDTGYANLSGTSMAGPHVAGLVALLISANPKLRGDVDTIENIIEQTAVQKVAAVPCGEVPINSVPNYTYGHGRINALAAVQLALQTATPVPLVEVVSRKTHDTAGVFNVPLPLAGNVGIEPRRGQPVDGTHLIVFRFVNNVLSVGNAAITGGTGTISRAEKGTDPKEFEVEVTGVTNAQTLSITLNGVTDAAGNSSPTIAVSVGMLLGDVNASRRTDNGDVAAVRAQSVSDPTSANFRLDVNVSGRIDNGDVALTRSHSVTPLP